MDVIAYSHTHWDREWYHSFEEYRLRFIEVFDEIIERLLDNRLAEFYLDAQTVLIDDYLEIFPQKRELLKDLIKQKRLYTGPWYVLSDELLPSGESIIRSLLYGIKQAKELGCQDFIGYMPDSFGHNSAMPTILRGFGIKNSVLWRGAGNKKSEFIWRAKDGSEVLVTHLIAGYFQDILSLDITDEKRADMLKNHLETLKKDNSTDTILLPIGADHLASVENLEQKLKDLSEKLKDFKIKEGSIFEYLKKITPKNLETFEGELTDNSRNFILPGVYSARTYIKQKNAMANLSLSGQAEPIQTMAALLNLSAARKAQIDYAWKLFLKNNPHDSICGCSIDEVHDEMLTRYEQLKQLTNGIIKRVQKDLIKKYPNFNLMAFNPSMSNYNGTIQFTTNKKLPPSKKYSLIETKRAFPLNVLHDKNKIPITEDMTTLYTYIACTKLNALSFDFFNFESLSDSFSPVKTSENSIENEFLKVQVQNGEIKITNLKTGKTSNIVHSFEDVADNGDTYNFAPIEGDKPLIARFIRVKKAKSSSHRGILRLNYEIDIPKKLTKKGQRTRKTIKHRITTELILNAQSKILEFKTKINNKSKDHLLRVNFHMQKAITSTISENAIGLIERNFDPAFDIEKQMKKLAAKMEMKTNTAPMQRFVCCQNAGVLTEGLQEYAVFENRLGITLFRATAMLSNPNNKTRKIPAGPPLITEGAQCLGQNTYRYGICFYKNEQEMFNQADIFQNKIIAFATENNSKLPDNRTTLQPFVLENKNIYLQSLKHAEDTPNAIVLRLLNLSDSRQTLHIQSKEYDFDSAETNLLEEPQNKASKEFVFKAYELKTILLKIK